MIYTKGEILMDNENAINIKNMNLYFIAGSLFVFSYFLDCGKEFLMIYKMQTGWTLDIIPLVILPTLFKGVYAFLSFTLYKSKPINLFIKNVIILIFALFLIRDLVFIYKNLSTNDLIILRFLSSNQKFIISIASIILFCFLLFNKKTGVAIISCHIILIYLNLFTLLSNLQELTGFLVVFPSMQKQFLYFSIASTMIHILFLFGLIIFVFAYIETQPIYKTKYNEMGIPLDLLRSESIAKSVILSLITLGIYNLIWLFSLCKKIRLLKNDNKSIIGEYLLLFFVPFYFQYWIYTRSKKIYNEALQRGINTNDNSINCVILALFGLHIIALAISQAELNTMALSLSSSEDSKASIN